MQWPWAIVKRVFIKEILTENKRKKKKDNKKLLEIFIIKQSLFSFSFIPPNPMNQLQ